jgi:hypothetical protein
VRFLYAAISDVYISSVSGLPGQRGALYVERAYAVRHSRYVLKRYSV